MKDFGSLTKLGKARRYRWALVRALEEYPIEAKSLNPVSFDSRPVYRVCTHERCYAAKFYNPSQHLLAQLLGEVQFLDHISGNGDSNIETPFPNRFGGFVTEIKGPWLPEPAYIVLYGWLPGRQLRNHIYTRSYRHLGRCSAWVHKASSDFTPDWEFDILTNDRVFYWDKETILSGPGSKSLRRESRALFSEGTDMAQEAIDKVWNSGEPIVIHNDLHPSNVKVHRGVLYLYDFEDICWGFPQQDIGTAMYHIRFEANYRELLSAFRTGYERLLAWPFDSEEQLDRFVIARLLMFANYVVNYNIRPAYHLPRFEKKLRSLLN